MLKHFLIADKMFLSRDRRRKNYREICQLYVIKGRKIKGNGLAWMKKRIKMLEFMKENCPRHV